jgi:hypothetical protein
VTASAFEAMRAAGGDTKGIPAESAARINLLRPNAINTKIVNSTPVRPCEIRRAIKTKVADRERFAKRMALLRENRSRSVPASGPTSE